MASIETRLIESLLRRFLKPPSTAEAGERLVDSAALRPASFAPPKRLRRDVSLSNAYDGCWPVYTVVPRDRPVGKVLIYLHGGAFYGEITSFHWRLIARIAAETGTKVLVPIYPLVPRGTAKETVERIADIVSSEVNRFGDNAVSIGGDSAGGTIALAVALDVKRRTSLRRIVLIHPAVDLSLSNPDIAVVEKTDPVLRAAALRPITQRWAGDLDIKDPRVSPLYGDMGGLAPMTVISGTHDVTNPDTRLLVAKARNAGVQVEYHEGEGLMHPSPALPTREGREARRQIIRALS